MFLSISVTWVAVISGSTDNKICDSIKYLAAIMNNTSRRNAFPCGNILGNNIRILLILILNSPYALISTRFSCSLKLTVMLVTAASSSVVHSNILQETSTGDAGNFVRQTAPTPTATIYLVSTTRRQPLVHFGVIALWKGWTNGNRTENGSHNSFNPT